MAFRYLNIVFWFASALWVLFVPMAYMATLDDQVAVRWVEKIPPSLLLMFAAVEYFLIPLSFAWALQSAWRNAKLRWWFGPVAGMAAGLWATTLFLTLPYVGGYPSLPSVLVGCLLSRGRKEGLAYYGGTFATNMVLWSVVGWLVFRRRQGGRVDPRA